METSPSPPPPAIDLPANLYYQLTYTLIALLPPPLDDSPQALHGRNHAAIAKVAALLPANANELDLAAQCIAARAQAEEMLRLLRQHANDIGLVIRLNAQYALMVRTSLSVLGRLMRVQAVRQKREATEGAAAEDARAAQVTELSMLMVAEPDADRQAAQPKADPAKPAANIGQRIKQHVSENGPDSHGTAFETWLSAQSQGQAPEPMDGGQLHEVLQEAMA